MSGQADLLNCGSCNACCRNDLIFLHPEHGDDPSQYQTMEAKNPLTGKMGTALACAKNGDCIYLDRSRGCKIHGRHPVICRTFNCVKFFLSLTKQERRNARARNLVSETVLSAARRRLP